MWHSRPRPMTLALTMACDVNAPFELGHPQAAHDVTRCFSAPPKRETLLPEGHEGAAGRVACHFFGFLFGTRR